MYHCARDIIVLKQCMMYHEERLRSYAFRGMLVDEMVTFLLLFQAFETLVTAVLLKVRGS